MTSFYEKINFIFDPIHHVWEHEGMHRKISLGLVLFFLLSLVVIELNRQGLISGAFAETIPNNHFHAIQAAFTVVLILEVISLIFTIPCSFSQSMGKQFEILALILMRNAFKELSYFPDPISFSENEGAILNIVTDGFGALIIFALLGFYYKIQTRTTDDKMCPVDLFYFVASKKGIALILLILFAYLGIDSLISSIKGIAHSDFLHSFYTILILADVLVVLISQCFQPSFYAVFRNSGFALSTVIIRIALAASPVYSVLLGIAAALFAILLTLVSRTLFLKK